MLVIGWVNACDEIIDHRVASLGKGYAHSYPILLAPVLDNRPLDSCVARGHAALVDRLVIITGIWVGCWRQGRRRWRSRGCRNARWRTRGRRAWGRRWRNRWRWWTSRRFLFDDLRIKRKGRARTGRCARGGRAALCNKYIRDPAGKQRKTKQSDKDAMTSPMSGSHKVTRDICRQFGVQVADRKSRDPKRDPARLSSAFRRVPFISKLIAATHAAVGGLEKLL